MNKFVNKEVYDDVKSLTNIVSGDEYKSIVYAISQLSADMVVKTLGPYGQTTIIDDGSTFTYPSKDGWACINRLRFSDPLYNTIFTTLKQISFSIVSKVGDGTTSALVGANAFLKQLLSYQENKSHKVFRQSEFLEELNKIRDEIVENLSNSKELHQIDKAGDFSDIRRIAMIASNENEALSDIIHNIYKETRNPNMYIALDGGNKLTYEIQEGYRFDCRTLNHKAYINTESRTCVKKDVETLIAIFDHNVSYHEHGELITGLSRYANACQKEIIIIAPYFDDIISNIIGTTVDTFIQQGKIPNIMLIQFPMSMEAQKKYLSDIVMITNSQLFDYGKVRAFNVLTRNQTLPADKKIEDALFNVDQYNFDNPTQIIETCVGVTRNVIIDEKYTIIQDYESIVNPKIYAETLKEVEEEYLFLKDRANKTIGSFDKDYMNAQQRYIKLLGKMGVVKVGGETELEKHCLKDAVDDAVLACKSAFENGYIRGLNLLTISTLKEMYEKEFDNNKNTMKLDILQMLINVFVEMTLLVLENKNSNEEKKRVTVKETETQPGYTLNMCNEEIINYCIENGYGYNLVTETLESEDELTVINSVSTDIEILRGIIGTLSLILTSNQFLSLNRTYDRNLATKQANDKRKEEKAEMASAIIDAILAKKEEIQSILFN